MIKSVLNNQILKLITNIEGNKYKSSSLQLPNIEANKLRKNSKKKSSYASNKIEGNPLSESQANEIIDSNAHKHFLKPEQEIRNYFLALSFLEKELKKHSKVTIEMILKVQSIVEKGASKEKIGLRGAMPPGVLFAVYDSVTGNADYIPPMYDEIPQLLKELENYIASTDDHPLIIAGIVHYQLVTIHPFEDGNGRTARLISGYIMDYYGYGFNGIGSLEEFFAYDIDEYYQSLQMGLSPIYYNGRNNPPNPEIWITYFLRMVELYSQKVCEISSSLCAQINNESLSYLNKKEKELLKFLKDNNIEEFSPIEISKKLSVSNRTIINRLANLVKNGFVVPVLQGQRIRAYRMVK